MELKMPPRVCRGGEEGCGLCFGSFVDPVGFVPSHQGPHFALIPTKCPQSAPDPDRTVPQGLFLQAGQLSLLGGHPKLLVPPSKPECHLGCAAWPVYSQPPASLASSLEVLEGQGPPGWEVFRNLIEPKNHPGSSPRELILIANAWSLPRKV